jgi:hypothetical protein
MKVAVLLSELQRRGVGFAEPDRASRAPQSCNQRGVPVTAGCHVAPEQAPLDLPDREVICGAPIRVHFFQQIGRERFRDQGLLASAENRRACASVARDIAVVERRTL